MLKTVKINGTNLWYWMDIAKRIAIYELRTMLRADNDLEGLFYIKPVVKVRLFDDKTWQEYARALLPLAEKIGHNGFMEFVARFFDWGIERNFDTGHRVYFREGPDKRGSFKKTGLRDLTPEAWEDFVAVAPMPEGRRKQFYEL